MRRQCTELQVELKPLKAIESDFTELLDLKRLKCTTQYGTHEV